MAARSLITSGSKQELPDEYGLRFAAQYEYTPRYPDVKPPLIDPRMYQILLSECQRICYWRFLPWHYCIHLDAGCHHVEKIPKKNDVSDLFTSGDDPAFGLEADYMLSLRILAAYHILTIVPAFAFWGWWLTRYPGDLQNASVPLMTVLALITVYWIMAGKRVGIA